jgi:putative hemin transport protein
MANNPVKFSHPYPATARLFQQARLARLARASLASATAQLSPTEGELLAAGIGRHVIPLNTDWPNILGDLFSLGNVRMVTAGICAFIERHGIYPLPEFSDSEATLFDGHTRIAIHLTDWGHAFAVFPVGDDKSIVDGCGLHFFDRSGTAMHRILLSPASSFEAFERIAEEL